MKTLYLDIFSGISGDMFLGAMIDLGVDLRALQRELAKLDLDGYHLHAARQVKANIAGVKFDVHVEAEHSHEHTHAEDATHAHSHDPHGGAGHSHPHAGPHHDHLEGCLHGPHGGPLVETSKGRVELSVFETNVPPRFRLYCFDAHGHAAAPLAARNLILETLREGGQRETFKFKNQGDHLEATAELPEPHEFKAVLRLKCGRKTERVETAFVEGDHHHAHNHAHGRNFRDIEELISRSALSAWVKQKSIAVFQRVAVAEGKVHGRPPEEVHFHEVGAVDSIIDIVGACVALELLGKPRVLAAPVVEGTGWVNCAHGRFPVPTMATLSILGARGIPVTQCEEPHELVTPTGAALLAEFAAEFGPMRSLVAARIGYGLGTRENETRPNVLRAVLGQAPSSKLEASGPLDWETDTIAVLETNLDDINSEILGQFVETALAAGALDVFHTPIQMKKSRPGVLLTVLCAEADADRLAGLMLRETTAFGVRRHLAERRKLRRESVTVKTRFGEVTVKLGRLAGQTVQAAPEFESCKAVAAKAGAPLKAVYEAAIRAVETQPPSK